MPTPSLQTILLQAQEHHRGGRLDQAEVLYRQILQLQPDQPDVTRLLGIVAMQSGRLDAAITLIGRAVQLSPNSIALNQLGEACRRAGRFDDAIAAYQRASQIDPNSIDAWVNLAQTFQHIAKLDDSIAAWERATKLVPGRADLHDRLGAVLFQRGDPYRAIASHRRALELTPNNPPTMANLALALAQKRDFAEAEMLARRAAELAPQAAEAHCILGIVLEQVGKSDEAIDEFARATTIDAMHPEYYGRRAGLLERRGRIPEGIVVLTEGTRHCPREPRLFSNLAFLLREQADFEGALRAAETAIALSPGYGEAHGHRAFALLALGDYARGFDEYEWRWRCKDFTTTPRDFKQPLWDGSDPSGRTVFVHTEQGFGDALQFVRYLPLLADRGATVILECNHALRKLFTSLRGVSRIIPSGLPLPDFHMHAPLMSLPRALGTTSIHDVPRDVPYIQPDPQRAEVWREKLASDRFKIGLIWAGNDKPDPNRTVPAEALAPLASVEGVQFYSLQKSDADTYKPLPAEFNAIDLDRDLTDFNETAAAMMNLDLIITIDSGGAHLAGALGRPTWIMLKWAPDWRWGMAGEDSPWYPTMRLFRQETPKDWTTVISRVRAALVAHIAQRGARS